MAAANEQRRVTFTSTASEPNDEVDDAPPTLNAAPGRRARGATKAAAAAGGGLVDLLERLEM